MKTVYLVRHGETEGNAKRVYQDIDTPLNAHGIAQAERLAERCAKLEFEALISSAMLRAKQTAEIIGSRKDCTLEYSDLFIERYRPDEIGGKSKDDPEIASYGRAWHDSIFCRGPKISNGEDFNDLQGRAAEAMAFLQNHPAKTLLVVSHGFFIRMLVATILIEKNLTPESLTQLTLTMRTNNTGISVIQYGEHSQEETTRPGRFWALRAWNDHAHLG